MNTKENQKIWIEKIHENLQLRGKSNNTFINYRCALMNFFKYFNEKTNFEKMTEEDIIPYLNNCFIKPNKSKYTYNTALASIRLFYLVCMKKALSNLLLPSSKTPKRLPTIMSKKTFIEVFNKEQYLKHKCWLLLAFCSGLRVHEVAKVKVEDINSQEHKLKVVGKGNKDRFTFLPDITIKFLRLYCKEKNIKKGYLFPGSNNRDFINEKTIINYFSTLKDIHNLEDNITFHSLRHSFATYYLSNGGSLLTLQSMLGHTNINTTTIYLHLSQNFNELEGVKYV